MSKKILGVSATLAMLIGSSISLFGQIQTGSNVRLVESRDTIFIYDPETYAETMTTYSYVDTLQMVGRNKVELRKQERQTASALTLAEDLSILKQSGFRADTLTIVRPDGIRLDIAVPVEE